MAVEAMEHMEQPCEARGGVWPPVGPARLEVLPPLLETCEGVQDTPSWGVCGSGWDTGLWA